MASEPTFNDMRELLKNFNKVIVTPNKPQDDWFSVVCEIPLKRLCIPKPPAFRNSQAQIVVFCHPQGECSVTLCLEVVDDRDIFLEVKGSSIRGFFKNEQPEDGWASVYIPRLVASIIETRDWFASVDEYRRLVKEMTDRKHPNVN